MVGSIDPRGETVRGIHWPATGRGIVWNSRRGNHLGKRPKATASTGRTYGCKRSDQTIKNSCSTAAAHIWMPGSREAARPGMTNLFSHRHCERSEAIHSCSFLLPHGLLRFARNDDIRHSGLARKGLAPSDAQLRIGE